MAKLSDALKKQVEEALKNGTPLPSGVQINFGDPEPYQTADDESTSLTDDDAPQATTKSKGK
jgi:hypothetical protein